MMHDWKRVDGHHRYLPHTTFHTTNRHVVLLPNAGRCSAEPRRVILPDCGMGIGCGMSLSCGGVYR